MNNANAHDASCTCLSLLFAFLTGCTAPSPEIEVISLEAVDVSSVRFSHEVENAIEKASSFSLVSVDPQDWEAEEIATIASVPTGDYVRQWKILGKREIDNGKVVDVLHALKAGIALHDESVIPDCFNPRHAIQIHASNALIEALICYECKQIMFFENGELISNVATSDSPRAYFEQLVRDLGLPSPTR